jgi:hypothetical protein
MVKGSTLPYAEAQESLKQMKKTAKPYLPRAVTSSEDYLYKKLTQINRGKEISAVQQRRVALDNRLNYELETERMMADLRRARMPAFRGVGARMMGVDGVAAQIA